MTSENFQPDTDETLDIEPSDAGSTTADPLSEQMGTDVCLFCRQRKSPADIRACEERGPGRVGCDER